MFARLSGLIYSFVKGGLTVEFATEISLFTWEKKLIFNSGGIEALSVKDIATVAIDQGELLRKIITSDREVKFGSGNLRMEGLAEVHRFLRLSINQNGGRGIDSWDV